MSSKQRSQHASSKKRGNRTQGSAHPKRGSAPMRELPQEPILVTIERMAWGGDGVGRLEDGRVVFVEDALPGQRVRAQLVESKKRFCRARTLDVVDNPIPDAPSCPTADRCGGCRFQGVPYALELEWKVAALQDSLERLGRQVRWPAIHVVPAPTVEHYRTRVRLRVNQDGQTGYVGKGSHEFVPAVRCDVLHPALEAWRTYAGLLAADLPQVYSFRLEWDGTRKHVVMEIPAEDDTWNLIKTAVLERLQHHNAPIFDWDDKRTMFSVALRYKGRWEALSGDGRVYRGYGSALVKQQSGQFSQANDALNRRLRERVADAVREGWDARDGIQNVADLFSGAGNLAFAIAERGARVVAIDHAFEAIEAGQAANPASGIERVARWVSLDLNEPDALPLLERAIQGADTVVLDPPRGGVAQDLLHVLAQGDARRMVYVSCDPPAFARDAERLKSMGWSVMQVEAWDMFPRTPHLELLAVLQRR